MQDVIRDWLLWFRLCRELIFCRYLYLLDLFTHPPQIRHFDRSAAKWRNLHLQYFKMMQ